jgi:hypothetical protein
MHILLRTLLLNLFLSGAAEATPNNKFVTESDLALDKPLPPDSQQHLDRLAQRALEQDSAHKDPWLALGHYQRTLWGHRGSAKGDFFYRSDKGKRKPHAELVATLEDFLYPPEWMKDQNLHPQCHFPARLAWLRQELQIPEGLLPAPNCTYLEEWKKDLSPTGVSIVFAGYYMGHPASIFGHAFLRIHGQNSQPDLMDHGVEFGVGIPDGMNPIQLAFMVVAGLAGQYSGTYSVQRYHHFTNKYSRKESRDLWNYPLDLSESESVLLVNHLWELGAGVQFRYSFMRNNCGFELLKLLDVVRPSISLQEDFNYRSDSLGTVLTLEAIRALQRRDMLSEPEFEPSIATVLDLQLSGLSDGERELADRLVFDSEAVDGSEFTGLNDDRKAAVVDTSIQLLKLRSVGRRAERELITRRTSQLLDLRSKIEVSSPPVQSSIQDHEAPLSSHAPRRTDFFAGQTTEGNYAGFKYRLGVHDLLDPPAGFPKNAHLMVPSLEVGVLLDTQQPIFQRLGFFDLLHIPPSSTAYKPTAFHVFADIHRETMRFNGAVEHVFDFNIAKGVRANLKPMGLTVYLLPGAVLSLSPAYEFFGQVGLGGEAGIVLAPLPRTRFHFEATAHHFMPLSTTVYRVNGAARLQLTHRISMGGEAAWLGPDEPPLWQVGLSLFH